MEQKQIVERNLGIYRWCKNNPCLTTTDEAQYAIKQVQDYEGWGRCRKLIDPNSDEYKTAYDFLESYGHKATEIKYIIEQARSASLTAFYTPTDIAKAITDFALTSYEKLNGKPARTLLDPSCGTGAFLTGFEYMDNNITYDVCEKDEMTRTILNFLRGAINSYRLRSHKTQHQTSSFNSYEEVPLDMRYDIIVSNMPFGTIQVHDKPFAKLGFIAADSCKAIHNYYFMKSLHLLNRGGIMAFITTRGFLSSNSNKEFREEMLRHGKVISIVRLPDNLFKTVDVGSDLIVYQKKPHPTLPEGEGLQRVFLDGWAEDEDLQLAEGMVIPNCEHRIKKNQYGKPVQNYKYKGTDMAADLKTALISSAAISLPIEGEGRGEGLLHLHYGNHFFMFFD